MIARRTGFRFNITVVRTVGCSHRSPRPSVRVRRRPRWYPAYSDCPRRSRTRRRPPALGAPCTPSSRPPLFPGPAAVPWPSRPVGVAVPVVPAASARPTACVALRGPNNEHIVGQTLLSYAQFKSIKQRAKSRMFLTRVSTFTFSPANDCSQYTTPTRK